MFSTIVSVTFPLSAETVQTQQVIGRSVESRPIWVHIVNADEKDTVDSKRNLVIIGGIHGGYEWNSVYLARLLLDYYQENPDVLPADVSLHIIPVLNPDGLHLIAGHSDPSRLNPSNLRLSRDRLVAGRVNANDVDLNRNFDSEWSPLSYHGRRKVGTGTGPFSEPETQAIRDYIHEVNPQAVVFIHSASNNIWYGGLPDNWLPAHRLASAYSEASGYRIYEWDGGPREFPITGTASGYFYKHDIPTIIIELATRYEPDLERNIRGMNALIRELPDAD